MPLYAVPGVYVVEVAPGAKTIDSVSASTGAHNPGVPVEESPSGAIPIEGVSTSTAVVLGVRLAKALEKFAEAEGRDWTDSGSHDPGVTLLEVFAWLAELLVYRQGNVPRGAIPHAARIATAALALIQEAELPRESVLAKIRFFPGHYLDDDGCVVDDCGALRR